MELIDGTTDSLNAQVGDALAKLNAKHPNFDLQTQITSGPKPMVTAILTIFSKLEDGKSVIDKKVTSIGIGADYSDAENEALLKAFQRAGV